MPLTFSYALCRSVGGMGLCSSVVWSANTAGHARIHLYGQAAVAAVLDREGGLEEIGSLE